ncbi:head morphogenesis protein [Meiothermus phage MMP7]|nr:head morphogenesis protein [Meiothermus phage MMP7]
MWRVSANPVHPEEAIAWFRARLPLPKAEWLALEERARRKAFTVAGVAQLDLLAEVWDSLARALEEGTPYTEWAKEARTRLEDTWGRRNSARLETIFRTNVQMAYSSGRWAQMTQPEVRQARPYWMYDAVLDNRTTSICQERHGTVLPADDPWWQGNTPPLHFSCRSGIRPLTSEQAQARGIAERLPEEPPQEGFGLSPDASEWGRAYARGITAQTQPGQWEPAFIGAPPDWQSYGRPERLPPRPAPGPLLPTVKEAGEDGFTRALTEAWGNLPLYVQDPTGMTVILDDAFLRHLKPDGRERFLSWLPDLVSDPEEVWLVPMRKVAGRAVAFRMYYIKLYRDERQRNVLFVGEFQKGVLVGGYTFFETQNPRYLMTRRIGFLRYAKEG